MRLFAGTNALVGKCGSRTDQERTDCPDQPGEQVSWLPHGPGTDGYGATAVSGRALHEFLRVKERYNAWLPRMVEYGFVAGQDFAEISVKPSGAGRPRQDHVLTLDMAKELSMIQRTERGKQARRSITERFSLGSERTGHSNSVPRLIGWNCGSN